MKDCFFGLLRNVICRSIDTRIFHKFGDNYIIRENVVREASYEEIRKKGFEFNSDFSLSHNQSDIVSQYLETVLSFKEKINFKS